MNKQEEALAICVPAQESYQGRGLELNMTTAKNLGLYPHLLYARKIFLRSPRAERVLNDWRMNYV
jgi:hypothetical protein